MTTPCQDIALLAKLPVLAAQAGEFLALGGGHHIGPRAILDVGVTHPAIDAALGSNSRDSFPGARPDRTRSTIWRRNSVG